MRKFRIVLGEGQLSLIFSCMAVVKVFKKEVVEIRHHVLVIGVI